MEQTRELCRITEVKDRHGRRWRHNRLGVYETSVRIIGFLSARAAVIPGLAPFGLAFMAVERRPSVGAVVSAAMAALGYISLGSSAVIKYICALCAYLIFLAAAGRTDEDIPTGAAFGALGLISALAGIGEMMWTGFSIGGVITSLCDCALTVAAAFAFDKNRGLLRGGRNSLFALNTEQRLCLAITAAIMLTGFKSVVIGEFFSASAVLGLWIVTLFSLCGGVKCSVLCGAAVGLLLGTADNAAEVMAAYTLCGLAGGITAELRWGKTAVCIAVCAAAVAAFFYGSEVGAGIFGYIDIPLATVLTLAVSDSSVRALGRISGIPTGAADEERCREYIRSRLNSAADSFRTLAETFLDLSDKHNAVDMEDISMMFDGTADRVCRECSRVSDCWVSGFNSTYKSMFKMLEIMERKGELCEEDADEHFAGKCLRLRAVVREMNRLFEIYKINCVWKSKLCENRELAGQQLGSVAQILDNIADELYEEKIDGGAEEEIHIRLRAKGVEVRELAVTIGAKGRYVAYICAEDTELEKCRRAAEASLRAVLGVRLVMTGVSEARDGGVAMRFTQPEGYRVEAAVSSASKSKDEECGDNCVMRYLSDGKYAAALSDGMGTGHRASRDSGATVSLLGDFLEAGFDKTVAVRLINSIMVMKSANEAFATVDMCVIDLFSGEAEFIKNGAEPSYIKRRESTEVIRAASLPVGVMQDMEIETFAHKINEGDFVVMLSDGLQIKRGHEDWIKCVVNDAGDNMPAQELADRIMDMAKALKGGEADDDMTVMVLKLHAG